MAFASSHGGTGFFALEGSSDEPGGPQGDNRARPPRSELEPSNAVCCRSPDRRSITPAKGDCPVDLAADAAHRRVVPEVSVLRPVMAWQLATHSRLRPSPSSPADRAVDGSSGHLSAARTSVHTRPHRIYSYLLKRLTIDRHNRSGAPTATGYIPAERGGFLYLVAIMDWATPPRSWQDCRTPWRSGFCMALKALARTAGRRSRQHRYPGQPFTSLRLHRCPQIGLGASRSPWTIFGAVHGQHLAIERLWRSLKYRGSPLHELTDGFKAERVNGVAGSTIQHRAAPLRWPAKRQLRPTAPSGFVGMPANARL